MARKVKFTKMHGCGNDYIYVNMMEQEVPNPQEVAIVWSDRHKGIGSDGLVLIGKSPIPEADYTMRIFNADGSEAMTCGNASRCIGKYLYDKALTTQTQIRLLTKSGIKTLFLHVGNPTHDPSQEGDGSGCKRVVESVTVDMGEPVLENESLFNPRIAKGLNTPLAASKGDGGETAMFVSMGNPHYVIFTDNVDQVGEVGPKLECHPAFPQRCNIEFAQVVSGEAADHATIIRTRVWERGSGITQACGTGACATAVAAAFTGCAGRRSQIIMDGGPLSIEWCESDRSDDGCFFKKNHVYMTGPAAFVFDGEIDSI